MNYNFEIDIIHYKKLKERKLAIHNELKDKNIIYNFIEKYDRDTLSHNDLKKFENDINNAYKANFLSHILSYENLLKSNKQYKLILEDDSIPKPIFYKNINKYLKHLSVNFDLFYISDGKRKFKLPIYKKLPFKYVYKKQNKFTSWGGHGASKFADAYFISRKCAEILTKQFYQKNYVVNTSIDWWKNEMISKYNLNVYWGEPTLVSTNLFETSLPVNYRN